MKRPTLPPRSERRAWRRPVAILCVALIASGDSVFFAQQAATPVAESLKIPADQLDSLVAPIALYPDPLLSQTLVASTYPLEIVQLQQWLLKNTNLKPSEISQAVEKQDWDPSIQAMSVFPEIVKNMSENIKWTSDLGNAFLAQQSDVMDAVQRMRSKAKDAGHLKSTQQQTVETKVVESKTVVVIEPSSPEVVYVPSYDPMMVWGAPAYPYPPVYYPVAGVISFGVGLAIGAAWGGGGWGWNSGWGGNNININNNNNYINHYNKTNAGRAGNLANNGGGQWRHNPAHRGGAPYGDRKTAQQFGGSARGDSAAAKQSAARQNSGTRQSGAADRNAGGINVGDRGSAARSTAGSGMGGDRVGNRETSRGSGQRGNAFSGASSGMSGGSARSSSQRGASSMGGSRGGGGFRGGGRRR